MPCRASAADITGLRTQRPEGVTWFTLRQIAVVDSNRTFRNNSRRQGGMRLVIEPSNLFTGVVMKYSPFVVGATFALASALAFAQANVQGSASTQSQSSVSAGRDGASATTGNSGSARPEAGHASAGLSEGTQISATLSKPVDASKNKAGDEVTATATDDIKSNGQVVIPKGSKLIGHVTTAKARGNKSSSSESETGGSAAS